MRALCTECRRNRRAATTGLNQRAADRALRRTDHRNVAGSSRSMCQMCPVSATLPDLSAPCRRKRIATWTNRFGRSPAERTDHDQCERPATFRQLPDLRTLRNRLPLPGTLHPPAARHSPTLAKPDTLGSCLVTSSGMADTGSSHGTQIAGLAPLAAADPPCPCTGSAIPPATHRHLPLRTGARCVP